MHRLWVHKCLIIGRRHINIATDASINKDTILINGGSVQHELRLLVTAILILVIPNVLTIVRMESKLVIIIGPLILLLDILCI